MAQLRVSVKNTFLDVGDSEQNDEKLARRTNRRARTEHMCSSGAHLTALEKVTIDNLNQLLGPEPSVSDRPRAQTVDSSELKPVLSSEEPSVSDRPRAQTADSSELKPVPSVPSSHSVSTMCSEDLDIEDSWAMRPVLSDRSVSTVASEQWECPRTCLGETFGCELLAVHMVQTDLQGNSNAQHCSLAESVSAPPVADFTHGAVPRSLNFAEQVSNADPEAAPTTMMIRNIPNRYTQRELIEELEALGYAGTFDFLYAPIDFGTMGNVGYAFVNFTNSESAARCHRELDGYTFRRHQRKTREKVATVSVAHLQGLQANLQHYEKAAVTGRARSKRCGPVVLTRLSAALF